MSSLTSFEDYMSSETIHTEFIDGRVLMNPPSRRHQRISRKLARLLDDAVPDGYEVLVEAGWQAAPNTVVEPDLMVALIDAPDDLILRVAPLLIVEITSPSTRHIDRGRKMELYAKGGVAHYWIVEPEANSMQMFEIIGDSFQAIAGIHGGGTIVAHTPFIVELDSGVIFDA